MKIADIKVGATYRNRGKGRTMRTVVAIGDEYRPERWYGSTWIGNKAPDEPGVLYETADGKQGRLYIGSFAKWCGSIRL